MKRTFIATLILLLMMALFGLTQAEPTQAQSTYPDPTDLGDAPDSTNHFGVPMTAYGGIVSAGFPTVYDGSAPGTYGPLHFNNPLIMHLGPSISGEREADIGPDQDLINNLRVESDTPDLDEKDDGLKLPDQFPHCEKVELEYQITNLGLVASFDQVYVNVWIDWDRSGDWGQTLDCPDIVTSPGGAVSEWAVQNQTVTLGAPGVTNHLTPEFLTYNPSPDRPAWVRITLSEKPAPAADGRGYDEPYFWGETEDYYWNPEPVMVGIHGVKWHDLDGDGVWDSDEPTIPGWPIKLVGSNGYQEDAVTDDNGHYWFTNLQPATYTVGEGMLPDWVQTYPNPSTGGVHVIDFDGSTNFENINFGNRKEEPCGPLDVAFVIDDTGSMNYAIDNIKTSLPSIVSLIDSASAGDYQVSLVTFKDNINIDLDFTTSAPAFNAAVAPLVASGGFALPEASDEALNTVINELAIGARPQDADYGLPLNWRPGADHRIIILITDALPGGFDDAFTLGIDDVNANAMAVAASSAGIKISSVQVGSNPLVTPIMDNYAMLTGGLFVNSPDGSNVAASIQSILEDCGGDETTGVHGYKWFDKNGNGVWDDDEQGLPDWEITLYDEFGQTVTNTVTNEDGAYWFMDVVPGTYTVGEEQRPGWMQTYPQQPGTHSVTIDEGQHVHDINFGNKPVEPGRICGFKFHDFDFDGEYDAATEPLLPGWTILLQLPNGNTVSTVTDDEGRYCFNDLLPGDYMLAELMDMAATSPFSGGWTQTTPVAGTEIVSLGSGESLMVPFGNSEQGSAQACRILDLHTVFSSVGGSENISVAISNATGAAADYNVQLLGLPAGTPAPAPLSGTSLQDGSTTFNILTPLTINIPDVSSALVDAVINYPPAMLPGSGVAYYQAIVTNVDTDETFGCLAAIHPPDDDGGVIGDPDLPDTSISVGTPVSVSWPAGNSSGNGTLTMVATVSVISPAGSRSGGVLVNGEPSTTVEIQVGPGQAVDLPVSVEATEDAQSGAYTIVVAVDSNGDGSADFTTSSEITVDASSTPTAATLSSSTTTIAQPMVLIAALFTTIALSAITLRKRHR